MPKIGFDALPLNMGLVLDLPFSEGLGVDYHDISREHTPFSNGAGAAPAWVQLPSGLWVLDFNRPTPDSIDCPAGYTVYDFTIEDFTLSIWAHLDAIAANQQYMLFMRGCWGTGGWSFYVRTNPANLTYLRMRTSQAATGNQDTESSWRSVEVGAWQHIVATRKGASCRIFGNGVDVVQTAGTHINPQTIVRRLRIGIDDIPPGLSAWDGQLALPRIYKNVALTATQVYSLFNYQRQWFGV